MSQSPELRYTPTGTVAHIVKPNLFDHDILVAPCGLAAHSAWWRGTGSQTEYDKAKALPLCKTCVVRTP